jgi:hypothetical protein
MISDYAKQAAVLFFISVLTMTLFAISLHAQPQCDAQKTIRMLSDEPQLKLSFAARALGVITTPFKRLGIKGWDNTFCIAKASGKAVRPAQHSTDGFWTIDVELDSFQIGDTRASGKKFIRLEVLPKTAAHEICSKQSISVNTVMSFGGPVFIDNDGPFLEIHPNDNFRVRQ